MSATTKEILEFLGQQNFVKFSNTDDFTQLSSSVRKFLKETGVYSSKNTYPPVVTHGNLKQFSGDLVQFGESDILSEKDKYCIDTSQNERIVFFNVRTKEIKVVNSSLKKFLECRYTMAYYYKEKAKEKYGPYYQNMNYLKYAKKLRSMLDAVEPGIEKYNTWENELFSKELGVI